MIFTSLKIMKFVNLIEKLSIFEHRNSFQLLSNNYQITSDDIYKTSDIIPNDDEIDDYYTDTTENVIENIKSLKIFIK